MSSHTFECLSEVCFLMGDSHFSRGPDVYLNSWPEFQTLCECSAYMHLDQQIVSYRSSLPQSNIKALLLS